MKLNKKHIFNLLKIKIILGRKVYLYLFISAKKRRKFYDITVEILRKSFEAGKYLVEITVFTR